jgi:hypothetical protein
VKEKIFWVRMPSEHSPSQPSTIRWMLVSVGNWEEPCLLAKMEYLARMVEDRRSSLN